MMLFVVVSILFMLTAFGCSFVKAMNNSTSIDSSHPDQENAILDFIEEINTLDNEYESWQGITPLYAYDLYDIDFSNVVASLYYMRTEKNDACGYVIIDTKGDILEYSLGEPIYDVFRDSIIINQLGNKIAYHISKENLPDDR
jgi:hypothetical protein